MPDFLSGFAEGGAAQSYVGAIPVAPTPPATSAVAPPAAAPALGLNLTNVIIIVSGDVNVTSTFSGSVVQRR